MTEIGLGSVIHAFRIPMGGHLLSLNQGLLHTLAIREAKDRKRAVAASNAMSLLVAAMKSLSPVGSKFFPMLAIAVQGGLYSTGIALFGANGIGVAAGMVFLSIWGFLQPLLFAALFFGGAFFEAVEKSWVEIARNFGFPIEIGIWLLVGAAGVKAVAAVGVGIVGLRADAGFEAGYLAWIEKWKKRVPVPGRRSPRGESALVGSFRDLLNPWFLGSFAFSFGFLVWSSKHAVGGGETKWIFFLRTVVASWGIFYLARRLRPALDAWAVRRMKSYSDA